MEKEEQKEYFALLQRCKTVRIKEHGYPLHSHKKGIYYELGFQDAYEMIAKISMKWMGIAYVNGTNNDINCETILELRKILSKIVDAQYNPEKSLANLNSAVKEAQEFLKK